MTDLLLVVILEQELKSSLQLFNHSRHIHQSYILMHLNHILRYIIHQWPWPTFKITTALHWSTWMINLSLWARFFQLIKITISKLTSCCASIRSCIINFISDLESRSKSKKDILDDDAICAFLVQLNNPSTIHSTYFISVSGKLLEYNYILCPVMHTRLCLSLFILHDKRRVICALTKLELIWPSTTPQENAFCSILA